MAFRRRDKKKTEALVLFREHGQRILTYLSTLDIWRLRKVCKTFKMLCDGAPCNKLDLGDATCVREFCSPLILKTCFKTYEDHLTWIRIPAVACMQLLQELAACKNIVHMDMQYSAAIGTPELKIIAEMFHYLRHLSLHSCIKVDCESLLELEPLAENIETLNLWGCVKCCRFNGVLKMFKALKYLCLSRIPITDADLEEIGMLAQLEFLVLDGTGSGVAGPGILKIAEGCSELCSLSLSRSHVTDDGLKGIAENLHHLQACHLDKCTQVTGVGVEHLISLCPELRYLNVTFCGVEPSLYDRIVIPDKLEIWK
jgi:hypothetical protein